METVPFTLKSKWHYFFYGMSTENVLAGMIADAESIGCEFLSVHMVMAPAPPASKLALATNGKTPPMIHLFRVFVRCPSREFPRIMEDMQKAAAREQKEGLRVE